MVKNYAKLGRAGLLVLGLCVSPIGWGETARQYCEEMYPVEAYEPEERQQYIEECIVAMAGSYDDGAGEYYDGTVEDFVESLPEDDGVDEAPDEAADASMNADYDQY